MLIDLLKLESVRSFLQVRRDARLELVGDNLEISGIGVHDGGRYSCEVETDSAEPLAVVHIVEILGIT